MSKIQELKKLMAESVIVPKPGTPLAIVIGFNDPVYCERKAMEYIAEAQACISQVVKEVVHTNPDEATRIWKENNSLESQYDTKMKMAVFLLTVARLQRKANGPVQS